MIPNEHDVLIAEIDRIVTDRAARRAADGHQVNVDLSPSTVADPRFLEHAIAAVRRYRARPSLITFEITDTAVDADQARLLGQRLNACGFRLALGDVVSR